jgi:hypothetical protein
MKLNIITNMNACVGRMLLIFVPGILFADYLRPLKIRIYDTEFGKET